MDLVELQPCIGLAVLLQKNPHTIGDGDGWIDLDAIQIQVGVFT